MGSYKGIYTDSANIPMFLSDSPMSNSDITTERLTTIVRQRNIMDTLHIRLFTVDRVTLPPGWWNIKEVQSPFWRFYQNREEGAFLTLPDDKPYPLEPNRVYFIPAGVRYSCHNERTVRHFYIHFDMIGLPRLTMRSLFDAPVMLPSEERFETTVANFAEEMQLSPTLDLSGQCRAKALIYEGIARSLLLVSAESRDRSLRLAQEREPVVPALEHIENTLSSPLSIPVLAALCCLSPDHFARRFKICVGQTPGDYIQERRVTEAARLLLLTNLSIDAIAANCGFANRNYLTRVFTRYMDLSPAAYRKGGQVR